MKAKKSLLVYPGGARKALTLRFDDAPASDRRMIELLTRYRLKATFYLSAGFLDHKGHITKKEAKTLYRSHEIANHTYHHIDPRTRALSEEELKEELLNGKLALEEWTDAPVLGYGYVCSRYGAVGQEAYFRILAETGHEYAVMGKENLCFTPDIAHRFDIGHSFRFSDENLIRMAETFVGMKAEELSCFFAMAHTYEFDMDRFPYGWDKVEDFYRTVSQKSDIWYTTNGELFRYLFAAEAFIKNPSPINLTGETLYYEKDGKVIPLKHGETL